MRKAPWLKNSRAGGRPSPWPTRSVALAAPVRNLVAVGVDELPYLRSDSSKGTVRIVNFDEHALVNGVINELRQSVVSDGDAKQVRIVDPIKACMLGRLLFAKLHPDIGDGQRFGSLGRRRISIFQIADFIRDGATMRDADVIDTLRRAGAAALGRGESLSELKLGCDYPVESDLADQEDLTAADALLDKIGADIAHKEHRLSHGPPKKGGKWEDDEDMYKNLNGLVKTMFKKEGHAPGGKLAHAATLVSLHDHTFLYVRTAEEILACIPDGVLTDLDKRVFRHMHLAKPGMDVRGRCEKPLMTSPSLAGLVAGLVDTHAHTIVERGRTKPKQRRGRRSRLEEVMAFIETGVPNRSVEYLVGQMSYYPDVLAELRRKGHSVDDWADPGASPDDEPVRLQKWLAAEAAAIDEPGRDSSESDE